MNLGQNLGLDMVADVATDFITTPPAGLAEDELAALAASFEEDARALLCAVAQIMPALLKDGATVVELSVLLCDDATIRSMNADWRGKDEATDVLSFAFSEESEEATIMMEDEEGQGEVDEDEDTEEVTTWDLGGMPDGIQVLGDLVISLDTSQRQAQERRYTLVDESRVLLVHGLLHLLGLDHEAGGQAERHMAEAEEALLKHLGWRGEGLILSAATGNSERVASSYSSSSSSPVSPLASNILRPDIRLVALDMDGTLLNESSRVSPEVADTIRAVLDRGIHVLLATGKARVAAMSALAPVGLTGPGGLVGLDTPGIFLQGLEVYGPRGELISAGGLSNAMVAQVVAWIEAAGGADAGLSLTAFHGDTCTALALTTDVVALHDFYHEPRAELAPSAADMLAHGSVRKLLAQGTEAQIESLRAAWAPQLAGSSTTLTQALPTMLEVIPLGIHKGTALASLLKEMGVPSTAAMAVGDGMNDLELVRTAGLGIAMGNAVPAVKAVAKDVVPSNDEGGVAVALQRYLLPSP
jgi:rRNA maturation RNase YbeY